MIQKLVIASHNAGKVREIGELIAPYHIRVISAAEAGIDEPEETGATFAANAELKALHSSSASGLPALADDSGLVVPAIGGAPGIYSARWAGPNKDFSVAFERIQKELHNIPSPLGGGLGGGHDSAQANHAPLLASPLRGEGLVEAYFICVLALSLPSGMHTFEGRIDGKLTFPPRGDKGFGYDPIFIPNGFDITFGEMEPGKKNSMSHRAQAFAKFSAFLKDLA